MSLTVNHTGGSEYLLLYKLICGNGARDFQAGRRIGAAILLLCVLKALSETSPKFFYFIDKKNLNS